MHNRFQSQVNWAADCWDIKNSMLFIWNVDFTTWPPEFFVIVAPRWWQCAAQPFLDYRSGGSIISLDSLQFLSIYDYPPRIYRRSESTAVFPISQDKYVLFKPHRWQSTNLVYRKADYKHTKAEQREVRRSARLKALLQPEVGSRRKESDAGLSPAGETLQDQAVGTLVLLLAIYWWCLRRRFFLLQDHSSPTILVCARWELLQIVITYSSPIRLVTEQTNGERGTVRLFASYRSFVCSVRLIGVFVCLFAYS